MKKTVKYSFCLFFLFATLFSNAQNSNLSKADEEFEIKNYARAVMLYQRVLNNDKGNIDAAPILKKLGECFNEMNQYHAAIGYFGDYMKKNPNADAELKHLYADLLLKTGEIEKALKIFDELLKKSPNDEELKRMVACCSFAQSELEKTNKPPVQNQELINSPQSEFGLGYFNNQLVFASQRLTDDYSSIHGRTNQGFSDLYSASYDSVYNMYNKPERLDGEINSPLNEGTFAFNQSTNTAYFTQCKKNPDLCKILKAKYEKKKWVNIEEVSFGQPKYDFAHPSLSSDGKTIYFSSNMPGGFGGKDIWKAQVLSNGMIGKPEHLGEEVNTPEDELFPKIIGDSILLFASEGHIGMGGLDIFYSKYKENIYEPPVNVGAPINSTSDDFSILVKPDLNGGYFCTNRNNIQQSDDIFAFFHNIFLKDIHGKVVDSLTFTPVEDVKITYSTNNVPEKIVYSDEKGKFSIPYSAHSKCGKTHNLDFEKEDYLPKKVEIQCSSEEPMLVFLYDGSGRFHTLVGNIYDKNTGQPVDDATVTLKSLKGLNDTTFTDPYGSFRFDSIPADDYIVLRASKENYLNDSKAIRTPGKDKDIEMSKNTGYDTDFELVPIELEVEFDIENIYYEFDKARLLDKSKSSLNELVNLLKENPMVKIQVNSHTDERGTNVYNMDLSDRRSASVVNYLAASGINNSRLISRGFGESQPEIKNAKTEEEHQQNRRTTFEILGKVMMSVADTEGNSSYTPKEVTAQQRDEELFNRIRKAHQEGSTVSGESMLELQIQAGMQDNPDNKVNVESGEVIKVEEGELIKTVPEITAMSNAAKETDVEVVPLDDEPETKAAQPIIRKKMPSTPVAISISGTVYRVQLVVTSKAINLKTKYSNISDLIDKHGSSVVDVGNLKKYQLGNFGSRTPADELKAALAQRGYKDCFVVTIEE